MNYPKKLSVKTAVAVFTIAAVIIVMALLYIRFRPQPSLGYKTIQVQIQYQDGESDSHGVKTDAKYLEEALANIPDLEIDGSRTEEFGLMILTVNGVRADYQKDGAYWALSCDGQPCRYGVSLQPIADGEVYLIAWTPAS